MRTIHVWVAVCVCTIGTAQAQSSWVPPIGIPVPSFGLNEVAPESPTGWAQPAVGFYYVDAASPAATDSSNPYGSTAKPRRTIPTNLPAGSVVELRGPYARTHSYPYHIVASGTAEKPVFIRGSAVRPVVTRTFRVTGSYFIIENIDFAFQNAGTSLLRLGAPADHAALRHCDVRGNLSGGGIGIGSYNASWFISDVLVYNNVIHDNGDVHASFDQDIHGITVNARVSRLWIVDNEIARNSGTGVQVNAGSAALQPTVNHIYLGRNVSHHNKQAGLSTKQSVDTIFSQNTIYGHRASNSSPGQGMNGKYGPERAWYIFNHVFDNELGITVGSTSGLGTGRELYFVGNLIHDIHYVPNPYTTFNPNTGWANSAIMMADGANRYVVGNTIYDVDGGIYAPSGGAVMIANNIISRVGGVGNHVFVEKAASAAVSTFHHNLLEGVTRIRWGGQTTSLNGFRQQVPTQGEACINADPLFAAPESDDFRIENISPARGAAAADFVYARFFELYGLDIRTDIAGVTRPAGSWSLGVYEPR